MTNKMKKMLENQQRINEAAQALVDNFKIHCSMADYYEHMAKTQAMMLATMGGNLKSGTIDLPVDVAFFFDEMVQLFEMLKPFDQMAQEE